MKPVLSFDGIKINKIEGTKYLLEMDDQFMGLKNMILELFSLYEIPTRVDKSGKIHFSASSLQPLPTFLGNSNKQMLTYDMTVTMGHQMKVFVDMAEKTQKTIPFFSLDDILVLNKKTFLFVNFGKMIPLVQDKIKILMPIQKNIKLDFLSPEMKSLKKLPDEITYKSCYFSLGLMLIHCIFNKKYEIDKNFNFKENLPLIYSTPLYWFIVNSLKIEESDRTLIFM